MPLNDRDYMRDQSSTRWSGVMWPDAVTGIIVINVVVFFLQHLFYVGATQTVGGRLDLWGAFSLQALKEGHVWTIFTHMFVHQGLLHILLNCAMIFFAGKSLQSLVGQRHFLYIYFLSGLAGAALQVSLGWLTLPPGGSIFQISMIGASACGFGVLMALATMLPREEITAMIYFVIPVRLRLWTLGIGSVAVAAVLAVLEIFHVMETNVAHFAHIGGALGGWWYVRMLGYGGSPVTYDRLWHERHQRQQQRELVVVPKQPRVQQRKVRVVEAEVSMPRTTKEFIEREIDPILEKIAAQGIGSLTDPERKLLEQAREQLRNKK